MHLTTIDNEKNYSWDSQERLFKVFQKC
jgi:hypothetical protein